MGPDFFEMMKSQYGDAGGPGGGSPMSGMGGMGAMSQPGLLQLLMQQFEPASQGPNSVAEAQGQGAPMDAGGLPQLSPMSSGQLADKTGMGPSINKGIGAGLTGLGKSMGGPQGGAGGAAPRAPVAPAAPMSPFQAPAYTPPGRMGGGAGPMTDADMRQQYPFFRGR